MRSNDIKDTLPREAKEFEQVTEAWKSLTAIITPRRPVVELTKEANLLELLAEADEKLERIMKSLSAYLELKRESFPRFYFLSNEELLEILGESKKPERVQAHFKKCFEGIDRVIFQQQARSTAITTIVSKEGERVELIKDVSPADFKNNVEEWLRELEVQMEKSIQDIIHRCILEHSRARDDLSLRKKWLLAWQGQAILASSQQLWTERVEQALSSPKSYESLRSTLEQSQQHLAQIVGLVREALPELARRSYEAK